MITKIHNKWAEHLMIDCANAQSSILITSMSLHPPRKLDDTPFARLWAAWIDAAKRGVDVQIIVAAPAKAHPATAQNISAARFAAARLVHVDFAPPGRLLHAKTACIDKKIAWVGSGNMTAAAAHFNHEAYVRHDSAQLATELFEHWKTNFPDAMRR